MTSKTKSIIIYDAEYWADEGSMHRGWGGLKDHPPYLIQFSAIKVKIEKGLPEIERCNVFMKPVDEFGNAISITRYFSDLTNITNDILDKEAVSISTAMADIKAFVANDLCYSYGGDEKEIALSCYHWKQQHPLTPINCRDVRKVLHKAGMSEADILANSSGSLASFFGLNFTGHVHDASDDSLSILMTFRHFIEQQKMTLNSFK
ncbi:MAG: hypothetical protein ACI9TY_001229 [Alphaproteobacteria bacterium]|jgi:hypothetical protein